MDRGDGELLEAWRAGDRAAGSALFERHIRALYRFFSTKAPDNVDDLIQKTFTACVGAKDRIREGGSFRVYVFRVARNELYDYWRSRKRDRQLDFNVSSLHDLGPSPSSIVARKAEHRLLAEALRRIPLELQLATQLFYWEGLSGPELAEVLGIPEGTVRSRLRRAREALEAEMRRLADNPDTLRSTVDDLEAWTRSLAGCVALPSSQ